MAPRFAPGDDVEVRDHDGRIVGIHVTRDMGDMIEGRVFGLDPRPYTCGQVMIFPADGARPIAAAPLWRHADGLVTFAGGL